jgi:hypothetical protein
MYNCPRCYRLTTYACIPVLIPQAKSQRPRVGVIECGSPAGVSDADALIVDLDWIHLLYHSYIPLTRLKEPGDHNARSHNSSGKL